MKLSGNSNNAPAFWLRVFNNTLCANYINTASVLSVPDSPTNVVVTPTGNTQVSIAFTPPVSNGGSAITTYTVTVTPGNTTVSGASSPIVISGLTQGTAYTFSVVATNTDGESSAPATSNSFTITGNFYWDLNGNSGTTTSNYIGTNDSQSLKFKTHNTERLSIDSNGAIDLRGNTIKGFKAIVEDKSESYTLMSSDNAKILTFSSENNLTVTVPTGLPIGFNISIIQKGMGQIVFVAASGVELNNRGRFLSTVEKFSVASIICYASNVLVLTGDLD